MADFGGRLTREATPVWSAGHRCRSSDNPSATDQGGKGEAQDLRIEQERPLADVLGVENDHFFEVYRVAAAADLPQTGDPGLGTEAAEVMALVGVEAGLDEGPRTDERHLSDQDVPQLRQLINRPAPQPPAHTRDARVVGHLENAGVV